MEPSLDSYNLLTVTGAYGDELLYELVSDPDEKPRYPQFKGTRYLGG